MRIFILCTGRTGSVSFIEACKHMQNFSAGHESRSRFLGTERMNYPDMHIEADNRLSWMLGRLEVFSRESVRFVHLIRDEKATAASHNHRWNNRWSIIRAYAESVLFKDLATLTEADKLAICIDYVHTVNENIAHYLADKNSMVVQLENIQEDFAAFWQWIGAEGDLDAALKSLQTPQNSQIANQTNNKSTLWQKFKRSIS
jgi:hypothetical protein